MSHPTRRAGPVLTCNSVARSSSPFAPCTRKQFRRPRKRPAAKMALTLVTYPGNFRAFKALIAAEYAGVEIAVKDVDAKAAA